MRNQETKAQIMKNKSFSESHPNQGLQKLFIKNAQTKSEIKTNIALNEMLTKIPGQENSYVARSGHIMSKNSNQPSRGRAPPRQNYHNQRQQQPPPGPPQTNVPYPNHPFYPKQFWYMPNMAQTQGTPQPHAPHAHVWCPLQPIHAVPAYPSQCSSVDSSSSRSSQVCHWPVPDRGW